MISFQCLSTRLVLLVTDLGALRLPLRDALALCTGHLQDGERDEHARLTFLDFMQCPRPVTDDFERAELLTAILDEAVAQLAGEVIA